MMLFLPRRSTHGTGTLGRPLPGDLRRATRIGPAPAGHASYRDHRPRPPVGVATRPPDRLGVRPGQLDGQDTPGGRAARPVDDEPADAAGRLRRVPRPAANAAARAARGRSV